MSVKQRNFRLDDESVEKFNILCQELGVTQAQGFAHVMQVVELETAKSALTERQLEIEDFQQKVKSIISAYLFSLEMNENAEARARDGFISQLESKDKVIEDYQRQIESFIGQVHELEDRVLQADALAEELLSVQSKYHELKDKYELDTSEMKLKWEKDVVEKGHVNQLLVEQNEDLKQQLATVIKKANEADRLASALQELKESYRDLETQFSSIEKESEHAKERALMEQERIYTKKIAELEQAHKLDVSVYEKNVRENDQLLSQLERSHHTEMQKLAKEHAQEMKEIMERLQDLQEEKSMLAVQIASGSGGSIPHTLSNLFPKKKG